MMCDHLVRAASLGLLPLPLVGEGWGGGWCVVRNGGAINLGTPTPNPSPQGGRAHRAGEREHTELAERERTEFAGRGSAPSLRRSRGTSMDAPA